MMNVQKGTVIRPFLLVPVRLAGWCLGLGSRSCKGILWKTCPAVHPFSGVVSNWVCGDGKVWVPSSFAG